jgi:hypothetical protein
MIVISLSLSRKCQARSLKLATITFFNPCLLKIYDKLPILSGNIHTANKRNKRKVTMESYKKALGKQVTVIGKIIEQTSYTP